MEVFQRKKINVKETELGFSMPVFWQMQKFTDGPLLNIDLADESHSHYPNTSPDRPYDRPNTPKDAFGQCE